MPSFMVSPNSLIWASVAAMTSLVQVPTSLFAFPMALITPFLPFLSSSRRVFTVFLTSSTAALTAFLASLLPYWSAFLDSAAKLLTDLSVCFSYSLSCLSQSSASLSIVVVMVPSTVSWSKFSTFSPSFLIFSTSLLRDSSSLVVASETVYLVSSRSVSKAYFLFSFIFPNSSVTAVVTFSSSAVPDESH